MKSRFERVLVALDLSAADLPILRLVAALQPYLGMKKIYFLHVMPDFNLPKNIDIEFHKLFTTEYPVDEKVRDKIALDVQEVFGERPGVDLQVEVIEGKPFQKLLHWAEIKDIDLLVVGRKKVSEGSGITARRLARYSHCHVLFAPDTETADVRKILAPIDFSDSSANSLKVAVALARQMEESQVNTLYVVDLPPSDYYMRPFENEGFRQVLREAAHSAYYSFLEEHGIEPSDVKNAFIDNAYSNTALHINEFATQIGAGLIIIGAQGHSRLENFIFGSVTEKVVDKNTEQPVLIIR